jgi:hypothetical protein
MTQLDDRTGETQQQGWNQPLFIDGSYSTVLADPSDLHYNRSTLSVHFSLSLGHRGLNPSACDISETIGEDTEIGP